MTRMSRTLLALPIVLAIALPAAPALAATSGTTGYYNTPAPSTAHPGNGVSPAKETSKPRTTTSPTSSASPSTTTPTTTPTTSTTTTTHATTLPFTGLDLRWVVGLGVLLIGAGISIQMTQRRKRYGSR
jgi:hypothetical protein